MAKEDLEERVARLEQSLRLRPRDESERARMAAVGTARRAALGVAETPASNLIRKRIAAIAGKNDMLVEWTLRPRSVDVADVACGCFCGCGCSCIA